MRRTLRWPPEVGGEGGTGEGVRGHKRPAIEHGHPGLSCPHADFGERCRAVGLEAAETLKTPVARKKIL